MERFEEMRFTAQQDFFSEELGTQYVAGLSYSVGPTDDRLRDLVAQWVEEGRVVLGGVNASVIGRG